MYGSSFTFLGLAMVENKRGNQDRARDWYLASRIYPVWNQEVADFGAKVASSLHQSGIIADPRLVGSNQLASSR